MRTLLLILLSALAAPAAMVQLSWGHGAGADGYRLYIGTNSGDFKWRQDIPLTNEYVLAGLMNGRTYYFMMTSTNAFAESLPSDEVWVAIPADWPPDPVVLVKPTLLASTNLSAIWTNLQDWPEIVVPTVDKELYFKLKLEMK